MVESSIGSYGYRVRICRYKSAYGSTPMQEICENFATDIPFYNNGDDHLELFQPKFWGTKKDDDSFLPTHLMDMRSVVGKVCVYDGPFVDEVVVIALESEMLALIVTQPSTKAPLLPVFCFGKDAVKNMLRWIDEAKVVVSALPDTPAISELAGTRPPLKSTQVEKKDVSLPPMEPEGTLAHPLKGNEEVIDDRNSMNSKTPSYRDAAMTTRKHTSTEMTAQDATTSSSNTENEESLDDFCTGDDDNFGGTNSKMIKTKRQGFVGKFVGVVTDVVFGSSKLDDCFRSGAGWTSRQHFNYRQAMEILATLDRNDGATTCIVEAMPDFLNHAGGNLMMKLAFAGLLWTRVECPGKSELLNCILSILENCDFIGKKPDLEALQRSFREEWKKPTVALSVFFSHMIKHVRKGKYPKFWVNILWLWMTSGLFKSPNDWESWVMLRQILGSEFWLDAGKQLRALFHPTRFRTIALLLQENVQGAHNTLVLLKKDNSHQSLFVDDVVETLIEKYAKQIAANAKRTEDCSNEWRLLFEVLAGCYFCPKRKTQDAYARLIKYCMQEVSFSRTGSFYGYSSIVGGFDRLGDGGPFQAAAKRELQHTMHNDLSMHARQPSPKDVYELCSYSWSSDHLNQRRVRGALFGYARKSFEEHTVPLHDKLVLLDGLRAVVGETALLSEGAILGALRRSLSVLAGEEIIEEAFEIARDFCDIYCDSAGSGALSKCVTKIIVDEIPKRCLTKNTSLMKTAILATESPTCGAFAQCLSAALKEALLQECTSMRKASIVFAGIVARTDHGKTQSMRLASMLLCESFPSWRPRSVHDMASEGVQSLGYFIQCLNEIEAVEDIAEELHAATNNMKCEARQVFASWLDDFQLDQLSSEDLQKGLEISGDKVWSIITSLFDLALPGSIAIGEKVAELSTLVESISQLLTAPHDWGVSLSELLRVYDCTVERDSRCSKLFTTYSSFVKAAPRTECEDSKLVALSSARCLKLVREDEIAAKVFWDSCEHALKTCDYFHANPSIIFQDKLALSSPGGYRGVYDLKRCVEQACQLVKSLFGQEAALDEIKEAVSTYEMHSTKSRELELSTLRRCSLLDLCQEDCDRFLFCAIICRIYDPLGQFIIFCEQFKFNVVESDTDFLKLKQLIDHAITRNKIDDPEDMCKRLENHIFTGDSGDIESIVPLLRLFGCVSNHQEIWKLADEKQWFGKEGLHRFLNQLDHLTNVHLDSYAETFLEVMEPVIRIISILGDTKDKTGVASLLNNLQRNHYLFEWLTKDRFHDFQVVQDNLDDVRHWFCEGRDEISSVYSDFQSICRTGRYSILVGAEGSNGLCLDYLVGLDSGKLHMNSFEIQAFVEQQLTIIQHDDGAISQSIALFLEQYDILCNGTKNVLKLYNLGMANSGHETFVCSVNCLEEAQELFEESKSRIDKCEVWLQNTRKRYPLSLLWWPEELREMHVLLGKRKVSGVLWLLASQLLRLFPPDTGFRFENEKRLVEVLAETFASELESESAEKSWLLEVSIFIHNVYKALDEPRLHYNCDDGKELVVHTISCDGESKDEVVLNILQTIYKDRLPMDYEILDGLSTNIVERLPVFLERAKLFHSSVFVVVNTNLLKKMDVASIRAFMSSKDAGSDKVRLHCIQREPILPQASPFFEHRAWTNDKLLGLSKLDRSIWRKQIIDKETIKDATLVLSSACCTGKTRYVRTQQQLLVETFDRAEVGTITVHEGSNADDLSSALVSKFSNSNVKRCLHISVLSIPDDLAKVEWLQQLNKFFFSLFVLRSFHANGEWQVYVEFPSNEVTIQNWQEWTQKNLPILGLVCQPHEPTALVQINEEARRVCTYLRAYEDGSINDKFEAAGRKQIVFVLDRSESMEYEITPGQTQLSAATDCALRIFDSHVQFDDMVGVLLFNHQTTSVVEFQEVDSDETKLTLRAKLHEARHDIPLRGGTFMYSALSRVVGSIEAGPNIETWIVVLTDGDTDKEDTDIRLRQQLQSSRDNLHLIIVGINLFPDYEAKMRLLCQKYHRVHAQRTKGFYVGSDSTLDSLQRSFLLVSKQIPVSQTFDLLGAPTDDDCRALIRDYCPLAEDCQNMQLLSFWIRFLYRRVTILDKNEGFNFNSTQGMLGSVLMGTMLSEVSRLIQANHKDIGLNDFAQLVFDLSNPDAPEFRLLTSSTISTELKAEYEGIQLPGFYVPSKGELESRKFLDSLISQAIGVPLEDERLRCIDERGFVLTLDFAVKLLNIHERVATGVPCIIEGETGVSKTALTEMYSVLCNTALMAKTGDSAITSLASLALYAGYPTALGHCPAQRLVVALRAAQTVGQDTETTLSVPLHQKLIKMYRERSPLFQAMPTEFATTKKTSTVIEMVEDFEASKLETTFFVLNVHSSLSEDDLVAFFRPVQAVAQKLITLDALVVVFLDEVNTSSTLGIFKEIVVDRSLLGDPLQPNIVVVAACNPVRRNLVLQNENKREVDLGRSWTSGHYQVAELPSSMDCVKWYYGALSSAQEKEFIHRKISTLAGITIPLSLHIIMTEMITASQQAMREFAVNDMERNLRRQKKYTDEEIHDEATVRSKSVVSLRDIQRVFVLIEFFCCQFPDVATLPKSSKFRHAMLLSVAVVYFLRLDSASRLEYLERILDLPGERDQPLHLEDVLNAAMENVITNISLRPGIAPTRGLKENAFATLVCTLSNTPLMIVGPPGCSKTLSVNAVGDNASGEESPSAFFRDFPRLSLYHYQCSKESTSREIAAVFDKATRRQQLADSKTTRCVVFMDEAGLPEEKRESLKILHYLLEGGGQVGFVALSNHVVDAAKSNRMVLCFRSAPEPSEMVAITEGILINGRIRHVDIGDGRMSDSDSFCNSLCRAYSAVLHDIKEYPWLESFFGLRDYIYFLKAIRSRASFSGVKMTVALRDIVISIERNFNGIPSEVFKRLTFEILSHLVHKRTDNALIEYINDTFRCPMMVISQALSQGSQADALQLAETRARFKLIIDGSDDDSIMRLLRIAGLVDLSSKTLFKLSQFRDEKEREKLRLISGVKFAAMQGHSVLLSQTESVDESFYDLQNQNFREIEAVDGTVTLYANIAAGGVSHRSPVNASFNCIVHVRESQLASTPAPFLNRFEKFKLDLKDVLASGWASLGGLAPYLHQSRLRAGRLISLLGERGIIGCNRNRTLDSIYIEFLPKLALCSSHPFDASNCFINSDDSSTLAECLLTFLSHVSSIHTSIFEIEEAFESLPEDLAVRARQMMNDSEGSSISRYQGLLTSMLRGEKAIEAELVIVVCTTVIQMIFTRHAVSWLLQIATPEAVYAQRQLLPNCLVEKYFSQEHFSLKRLLMDSNEAQLLIVHTRTDASIHSIPSYGTKLTSGGDKAGRGDRSAIRALVCEADNTVLVEHLDLLQSESSFRKALTEWTSDKGKHIFLLLVDMSKSAAFEKVNYVRMLVEQCACGQKTFALLLHYPANSMRFPSYPTLFLGNWKHVFLDGVGQLGPSLGLSESIQLACIGTPVCDTGLKVQLSKVFVSMMPTVASHLASKNLFYKSQVSSGPSEGIFLERRNFVTSIFESRMGEESVGSVLCAKFAAYWLDEGLQITIKTACLRLQQGTTQLSVTGAIHGTLLAVFDKYMMWCVTSMNTWQGLDVLKSGADEVVNLFEYILTELPVLPFDELMLLQDRVRTPPAMPPAMGDAGHYFPFFFLVSSCLEEVLEFAIGEVADEFTENDAPIDQALLLKWSTEELSCSSPSSERSSTRKTILCSVVRLVLQSENLFTLYLHQFIKWKAGCLANPFIVDWLKYNVLELNSGFSIVAMHCVARCCEIDFMKAASWSILADQQPGVVGHTLDSQLQLALLLNTVNHIEAVVSDKECEKQKLGSTFSSLLEQLSIAKGVDKDLMCRIRQLCVANLVLQSHALEKGVFESLVDCIFPSKDGGAVSGTEELNQSAALFRLFGLLNGDQHLEEAFIQFFFSPLCRATMTDFRIDDFNFLLDAIESGLLSKHSHESRVSLLWRACMYLQPQNGEPPGSNFGISEAALFFMNSKLNSSASSQFEDGSTSMVFPHFIPSWFQATDYAENQEADQSHNKQFSFFSQYKRTMDGTFPATVFEVVLRTMLRQAEDMSSTTLLLRLLENLEEEEALDHDNHVVPHPLLQGLHDDSASLIGSDISAIIVDARAICFVAGFARELALAPNESVISGPYNEICLQLLEDIMTTPTARFADLFFSQLRRHKGEACLIRLLSTTGPLHDLSWCQEMKDGMPSLVEGQEGALRKAEERMAMVLDDEEKKARDLRLCPHCGCVFGVAALECGQFTCGQDAHSLIGRENHGCGGAFHVDNAPWYRIDEELLAPHRAAVDIERATLVTAHHGQQSWNRMRDYRVPKLAFLIDNAVQANLVPAVSILGSCDDDKELELIRVLIRGTELAKSLALLADLVEFYVWLHNTFSQLISKEDAMTMSMADIMTRERLTRRFDPIHTSHILSLWGRLVGGANCLLVKLEYKAAWGCTLIDIPFKRIEEARLISMLSEGVDPSEGFDSLFLIINQIVSQYNNFVQQLSDVTKKENPVDKHGDEHSVHPKFIMSGSGGSTVVNQLSIVSRDEIETLVAGSYSAGLERFDMAKLHQSLEYASSLLRLPSAILNPVSCLRTKFVFRREVVADGSTKHCISEVHKSHDGFYFARVQDLQLLSQVHEGLTAIGFGAIDLAHPDVSIRQLLCDEFRNELDSHNKTSAMLGGLRNLLEALSSGKTLLDFTTTNIGAALDSLFHGNSGDDTTKEIGFPELGKDNVHLLVNLRLDQTVELAQYLGFQLATEGYLYSDLPLCVSEPLPKAVAKELSDSIERLMNEMALGSAALCVKEFIGGVLVYFENLIVDAAEAGNQSLKDFLEGNNLCGTEDPVFPLLPKSIGIRNYVALRQQLQQFELLLLHRLALAPDERTRGEEQKSSAAFVNLSPGQCWMCQQNGEDSEEAVEQIPVHDRTKYRAGLWFADCLTTDLAPATLTPPEDVLIKAVLDEDECACRIQRWWRQQETWMSVDNCYDGGGNYFDTVSDMLADDMDMEMEEEPEEFWDYDAVEMPIDDASGRNSAEVSKEDVTDKRKAKNSAILESSQTLAEPSSAAVTNASRTRTNAADSKNMKPSVVELRDWLDANDLPGTMAHELESLGIRSIEDLSLTMKECEGILADLKKLDRYKLKKCLGL